MSKTRTIQREFLLEAFGFPVMLLNVPMVKVEGEWTPDVNYNEIEEALFAALPSKPNRLTGNDLRFIRQHCAMTLKAFGAEFGKSHAAVKKWEDFADLPTTMDWCTEKDIRLFVQFRVNARARDFRALYRQLRQVADAAPSRVAFDFTKREVAIA